PCSKRPPPETGGLVPAPGNEPPNAANLDADRAKIREPAQRKGRHRERPGVEARFQRAELDVDDERVEGHARTEQIADRASVAPRHSQAPGDRREDPAKD